MAFLAVGIETAHAPRITGMNVQGYFVVGNSFVGKLSDEMTGDGAAKFPAIVFSQFLSVLENRGPGDVRTVVEILFAVCESLSDVIAKFQLDWIGTEYKRPSKIGFPRLEHWS